MEEILASIRRIISEDEPTASTAGAEPAETSAAADDADEVLELTDPIPPTDFEPEPVFAPEPEPAHAAADVETQGDLEIFTPMPRKPAARPAPRPAAPQPVASAYSDDDDALLSAPAAASVASAFGQLARTAAMPAAGRSIEDVIREMLRPMLREWLDQHLPEIVEARVQAEVERLSRGV